MLPTIMGKMPYRSLPGFHVVPKRNSGIPISIMAGKPFTARNMHINATAKMETAAAKAKRTFAALSLFASFDMR